MSQLNDIPEKLTGRKFIHHPGNVGLPYKTYGVIPADWFSGVIQARIPNVQDSPQAAMAAEPYWNGSPFWKLTFEKGQLVAKKEANRMK